MKEISFLFVFISGFCMKASLQAQITPGAPGNFITTWQTNNYGSSDDDEILISGVSEFQEFDLYWQEVGNPSNRDTVFGIQGADTFRVSFPSPGTYHVEIDGEFLGLNFFPNLDDAYKLLTIEQWGDIQIETLEYSFWRCINLKINAIDTPDLSRVTSMKRAFDSARDMEDGLSHWDVSNVEVMESCFASANSFNEDLSEWDVSNVTTMRRMFDSAEEFNGKIDNWDVSNVVTMNAMFCEATSFNRDISAWDVSNVKIFRSMFQRASSFNSNLADWDMSNARDLNSMFADAIAFNQPIDSWDVNSAVTMYGMLDGARKFNRALGSWELASSPNMKYALSSSGISCDNYLSTIKGWSEKDSTSEGIQLGVEGLSYNDSMLPYRDFLISEKNWIITGDLHTEKCGIEPESKDNFITIWDTNVGNSPWKDRIHILANGNDFHYNIYWENVADSTVFGYERNLTSSHVIVFPGPGIYRVEIFGVFPYASFLNSSKLISLEQWGTIKWEHLDGTFWGCENMEYNAKDHPDLSDATSLRSTFKDTRTSLVGISNWDVSNIEDFSNMFNGATLFDADISNWDVSNAESLAQMFDGASSFNQDLSKWDVQHVNDMRGMFNGASSFNHDLSLWNVANVKDVTGMFSGASSFDQNLGPWILQSLEDNNLKFFFDNSGISCSNYEATLQGWAENPATARNQILEATGVAYSSSGIVFRDSLENSKNWRIKGDILRPECRINIHDTSNLITTWETKNSSSPDSSSIKITPYYNGGNTHYDIYWEKVSDSSLNDTIIGVKGNHEIVFPTTGKYRVEISGAFPGFYFVANSHRNRLVELNQWGDIQWVFMYGAFQNCANLEILASDRPDVSLVEDFRAAFKGAKKVNISLGDWDISNAREMSDMLSGSGLNCSNYDLTFRAWAQQPSVPKDISLNSDSLLYTSDGARWRDTLIQSHRWMIEGDHFREDCFIQKGDDGNFVTIWNSANEGGSEADEIVIPTNGNGYLYDVYWEGLNDSTINGKAELIKGDYTIQFPDTGLYRVEIAGDFPGIFFNGRGDHLKILEIEQWGSIQWETFNSAFEGCEYLKISASDSFEISAPISMKEMFKDAINFNSDIRHWNVHDVINMEGMLAGAVLFNQDLGDWELQSIQSLAHMMDNSGMSCENLTLTLNGWVESQDLPDSIRFGALNRGYSSAASGAADFLKNQKKWNFEGVVNRQNCEINPGDSSNFVGVWDTEKSGGNLDSIAFVPVVEGGSLYDIYWESVEDPSINDTLYGFNRFTFVEFPVPGKYEVQLSPGFRGLDFSEVWSRRDFIEIKQWGSNFWEEMAYAFSGCTELEITASDEPDLSLVVDLQNTFSSTRITDGGIGRWDVSNVENFHQMFYDAQSFNGDISNWDVSSARDMSQMFRNAKAFNREVNEWDVSSVVNFNGMFNGAVIFNRSLNDWNLTSAQSLAYMFKGAESFNQPLSDWQVGTVIEMAGMFWGAKAFNQSLREWDVSSVTSMDFMFRDAISFNQDLDEWNVSNVKSILSMFNNAQKFNGEISNWRTDSLANMAFSFSNAKEFDQPLNDWNVSNVISFYGAFLNAESFNQNLDRWNLRSAENLARMFEGASDFEGDISAWDIGNVTDISEMFKNATSFNRDISSWDVTQVKRAGDAFYNASAFNQNLAQWRFNNLVSDDQSASGLFSNSGLDCKNYSSTILGWSTNGSLAEGVVLGAKNMEYSREVKSARDRLINDKIWGIVGDSRTDDCDFCGLSASVIELEPNQCNMNCDGKAKVLVTNGIPPYQYEWNNGADSGFVENLCDGYSSVTIEDNAGCIGGAFLSLGKEWNEVFVETVEASCETCSDGEAMVFPENLEYKWETGEEWSRLENLFPGEYGVTVSDGDKCSKFFTVRIGPLEGEGDRVNDSTGGYTIKPFTSSEGGDIIRMGLDSEKSNIDQALILGEPGHQQWADNDELTLYPNPASDLIWVKSSEGADYFSIFNGQGVLIAEKSFKGNKRVLKFNISSLPSGIYFLRAGKELGKFVKK